MVNSKEVFVDLAGSQTIIRLRLGSTGLTAILQKADDVTFTGTPRTYTNDEAAFPLHIPDIFEFDTSLYRCKCLHLSISILYSINISYSILFLKYPIIIMHSYNYFYL